MILTTKFYGLLKEVTQQADFHSVLLNFPISNIARIKDIIPVTDPVMRINKNISYFLISELRSTTPLLNVL